jgi:hypothetical protein
VAGDRKTARINRNPASGLELPIEINVDGQLVHECLGWIIWSIGSLYDRVAPHITTINSRFSVFKAEYKFKFEIKPNSITDNIANDIPDLTGANATNPPDVTATDVGVWNKGVNLGGGANKKWDVTRRVRQKSINLANIPNTDAAHPLFYRDFLNFPSNLLVGNDDTHPNELTFPEDNDPYTAPRLREIHAYDSPSFPYYHGGPNADGSVGDTFEFREHFQEFARVELDGNWYVISAPLLWRFLNKIIKASESNDGVDYDGDGAQDKEVWIDNGSVSDGTNNGW